jgi:hypothetical protein
VFCVYCMRRVGTIADHSYSAVLALALTEVAWRSAYGTWSDWSSLFGVHRGHRLLRGLRGLRPGPGRSLGGPMAAKIPSTGSFQPGRCSSMLSDWRWSASAAWPGGVHRRRRHRGQRLASACEGVPLRQPRQRPERRGDIRPGRRAAVPVQHNE